MFAINERERPCSDLWFVSSDSRLMFSVLSWRSIVMPPGSVCDSSPFGPFTFTVLPSTVTVTPDGTVMGSLPIRDMICSLPDEGDELAAGARLTRFTVGHQALVGVVNREAEAGAHARDLGRADVLAKARRRHALQLTDHRLAAGVLEADAEDLLALFGLERRVILDVVVLLQDSRDLGLHLRHRNVDAAVLRSASIADPRQHVGDRVGHTHYTALSPLVSTMGRGGIRCGCSTTTRGRRSEGLRS